MQPRTAILPAALLIVALVAGAVSPSHAADVATSTLRSLLGSGMKTPETSVSFSIELFKAATSALGSSFKLEGSTIFAPTDKAFQDLAATLKLTNPKPADLLTPALKDTSVSILKFHVVPGKVIMAKDIPSGSTVVPTALEGKSLTVTKAASGVMIKGPGNSAAGKVIKTDIKFGTNIVHVVDVVLLP
ncbi:Fasciclin domain-containing protein [Haematococcus lacustris]